MNDLSQVENFNAKIYGTAEEPLFLARDIAEMLEIKNNRDMLNNVDDDEKLMSVVSTSGQNRQMWFLTESGLYEVLMLSRKPKAKEFKRKVKEILKTIRKHGAYNAKVPTTQRELVQLALSANEETNQRIDVIENKIHDIEENKLITTEDKGTIDSHVRKKVYQICKDLRLSQEAKSMLFKDLGSSIKQLFNVPNRGRIKDKDFMSALEFVESWEPSSVTKAKINQLSLFDRGIAS